jgi:hypothetical protein
LEVVTEAGYERIGGTQGNARERNDHQEGFAYRRSTERAETVFESFACGQQGLQGPQQRSVLQRLPRSLIGAVTLSQDVKYVTKFDSERTPTETIVFRESLTNKIIEIANVVVDNK